MVPVAGSHMADSTCIPVTGIMKAYLKNDPKLDEDDIVGIQSGLKRLIRWGMHNNLYLTGNVNYVSFIGTRTDEVKFDSVTQSTNDGNQLQTRDTSNLQARTVGVVGGMAAFVLFVAILLSVVGRPRRSEEVESNASTNEAKTGPSVVRETSSPQCKHVPSSSPNPNFQYPSPLRTDSFRSGHSEDSPVYDV